jgi:hypothetical protein
MSMRMPLGNRWRLLSAKRWRPGPSFESRLKGGCNVRVLTKLCFATPAAALFWVIRQGGSVLNIPAKLRRIEKTHQSYAKSPSQTPRRHLLSGDAHPAIKPRPHPARTGRKQVWLCLCPHANGYGRKGCDHATIFAAQDGRV